MRGVTVGIDVEDGVIPDKETDINLQIFMDLNIGLTGPWQKPVPGMPSGLSENPETLCKMILDSSDQPDAGDPPFIANPKSPLGKPARGSPHNPSVKLIPF